MLAAGELDRQVSIVAPPAPDEQNPFGEIADQGNDVADVWAKVERKGETFDVTIRWRPDVRPDWRIIHDGIALVVVGIPKELGRREGLLCTCKEQVK